MDLQPGCNHLQFEKLIKEELEALCVVCFVKDKPSGLKPVVVKRVEALHKEFPHVLEDAIKAHFLQVLQPQAPQMAAPPVWPNAPAPVAVTLPLNNLITGNHIVPSQPGGAM